MRIQSKESVDTQAKAPSKRIKRAPIRRRRISQSQVNTDTSQKTQAKSRRRPSKTGGNTKVQFTIHFEQAIINRLADLSHKFRMSVATGRFAFDLLKKFMSNNVAFDVDPFLLILGSFLICCKFYEAWGKLTVSDLVAYSGTLYGQATIIEVQAAILQTLDFELLPSPIHDSRQDKTQDVFE